MKLTKLLLSIIFIYTALCSSYVDGDVIPLTKEEAVKVTGGGWKLCWWYSGCWEVTLVCPDPGLGLTFCHNPCDWPLQEGICVPWIPIDSCCVDTGPQWCGSKDEGLCIAVDVCQYYKYDVNCGNVDRCDML